MSQQLRARHWRLWLLAILFFCLLSALGVWQYQRAQEKKQLLIRYHANLKAQPLTASKLNDSKQLRFQRLRLTGTFDNNHQILLDNKTFHGQIGYELYTPFQLAGQAQVLLVDRGFIPLGLSRQQLPIIPDILGTITITGLLNRPPHYFALGPMVDQTLKPWPLRIEYFNLGQLEALLNDSIYPYLLTLEPNSAYAYPIEWQIVTIPPERHMAYAFQWFALAFTLLLICLVLNWPKKIRPIH